MIGWELAAAGAAVLAGGLIWTVWPMLPVSRPPVRIRLPNSTDPHHLEQVMDDMRRLGPPVIDVVQNGSEWAAIDGSHRLTAAMLLGMAVRLRDGPPVMSDPDITTPAPVCLGAYGPVVSIPADRVSWIQPARARWGQYRRENANTWVLIGYSVDC